MQQANTVVGLAPSGSLPEQAAALMAALGLGAGGAGGAGDALPPLPALPTASAGADYNGPVGVQRLYNTALYASFGSSDSEDDEVNEDDEGDEGVWPHYTMAS